MSAKSLSSGSIELLSSYNWPGNVRELINVCRRLTAIAPGREITELDLRKELGGAVSTYKDSDWTAGLAQWAERRLASGSPPLLDEALPAFERTLIEVALRRAKGKRLEAARL